MRRLPRFAASFALLLLPAALPAAEIFGSAGWRKTYDDEGSLGVGAAGRVGAGWRWSRQSGLEAEFGFARHRREIPPASIWAGRMLDVSLSAVRHFGSSDRVEPYVLGGGGLVHYTNRNNFRLPTARSSASGYQLHAAFGVKAYLNEHVYFRPELRVSAGAGSALHSVVEPGLFGLIVSFGAGYRW